MSLKMFLIYYITELIMTGCMLYCYYIMNNKKSAFNRKNTIIIMALCILVVMNNIYNLNQLKVLCSAIIWTLMNKLAFNHNNKRVLFSTIIYLIISIIVEFATCNILSAFVNNIDVLNETVMLKMIYSLINCGIIIIIFKLFENKFLRTNFLIKSRSFYIISIIIVFILNSILVLRGLEINNINLLILSTVCIILFLTTLCNLLNDKYIIKIIKEKNKQLVDSNEAYNKTVEEFKELKHNLKHDLYFLKTSIPNKYHNEINELIMKYNKKSEWINKIDNIPEGLQGIFYLKLNEAKEKGIEIYLNTNKKIDVKKEDFLDVSNVVGILIDNAIEATELAKSNIIEVYINNNKSNLNIKIYNKFVNSLDTEKLGNKNYSTKTKKSGIGLNYIKNLENKNIFVNYSIINDLFISEMSINKM